ncbi:hypothetical protein C1645_823669 [Glomus cerebriforme]|uniref:Uncharacterized protein n=1 Tax=Glomus cerebriforme TaxID=658196 RepID=A0A397T4W0_9GLOM|nr:hypothetical protein C1645_823669 [Glomus cerebriforme]
MKYKSKVAANIETPEFSEVEEYDIDEIKLHVSIERKVLQNKNVKPADYKFVENYKKITAANKKMGVMIVIDENTASRKIKSIEKHSSKISDDEGDLSVSEEEKVTSRPKKKKKSHTTKEENLSKEEKTRAEIISVLCEKYRCNLHLTPCYIQDSHHLQLNPARLQLWA